MGEGIVEVVAIREQGLEPADSAADPELLEVPDVGEVPDQRGITGELPGSSSSENGSSRLSVRCRAPVSPAAIRSWIRWCHVPAGIEARSLGGQERCVGMGYLIVVGPQERDRAAAAATRHRLRFVGPDLDAVEIIRAARR